jgi:hypothetical protein
MVSKSNETLSVEEVNSARILAKFIVYHLPGIVSEIASDAVIGADVSRQKTEDVRANRRNRNRSYTLVVALLFTFMVPYVVADVLQIPGLLKYATGIAIIPDTFITLYAWMKHY